MKTAYSIDSTIISKCVTYNVHIMQIEVFKISCKGGGNQGKVTIQGDPLFQRFLAK